MRKLLIVFIGLSIAAVSCVSEEEFNKIVDDQQQPSAPSAQNDDKQVDDEKDTPVAVNNTPVDSVDLSKILGDWRTTKFTIDGSSRHSGCRLDDKMILNADSTYTFDSGRVLCGLADNRKEVSGKWEVDAAASAIVFNKGSIDEFSAIVLEQDSSKLVLKGGYSSLGMSFELRGTFVKLAQ